MKQRWIYLAALFVMPHIFMSPLLALSPDDVKTETLSDMSSEQELSFADLDQMNPEQLAQLIKEENVDVEELQELLLAQQKKSQAQSDIPTKNLPLAQAEQSAQTVTDSFEARVKKERAVMQIPSEEELDYQASRYVGEEALQVPEPKDGAMEVVESVDTFMNKYVRGKSKRAVILTVFILFRMMTYWYSMYLTDDQYKNLGTNPTQAKIKNQEDLMKSSFLSPMYEWNGKQNTAVMRQSHGWTAGTLGSIGVNLVGMNSWALEGTELLVRLMYCGTRLWVDMSGHIREFRYNTFGCLANLHEYMTSVMYSWRQVTYFFSDPLHIGGELSLMTRVLVGASVPFAIYSFLEGFAPGNPLRHPDFKRTLGRSIGTVVNEVGLNADRQYMNMTKPSLRKKLFKSSGGIIRERLFVDIASMMHTYIHKKLMHSKPYNKTFGSFMAKQTGKYAIRHVYMSFIIKFIKIIARNGGSKASSWLLRKAGDLLAKLGFFMRNPVDQSHDRLYEIALENEWISPGEDLQEMVSGKLCYICPGALVSAVQKTVPKEEVARLDKKYPDFVSSLSEMNGLSFHDVLQAFGMNPMLWPMIMQSVEAIRHALSPQQWKKAMEAVPTEIFIDQFLNRERFFCQFVTESIIGAFSRPLLKKINQTVTRGILA